MQNLTPSHYTGTTFLEEQHRGICKFKLQCGVWTENHLA